MISHLKQNTFQYYDERASEYDEIYLYGKCSTAMNNPNAYIEDTEELKKIVNEICFGDILDIPCGTAFWLSAYAEKCNSALLVDQSTSMLEMSKKKARENGIENHCEFIQADVLNYDLGSAAYDTIISGFFLSHLNEDEEFKFISKIKNSLNKEAKLLILDSSWSEERAKHRYKEGGLVRRLNNGKEFEIYKKYFEAKDIDEIGENHNLKMKVHHFGSAFCAFSGTV